MLEEIQEGGGWYGGGSGGNNACSSGGGGGSGWTFIESSFNLWKSKNEEDANKFLLDISYYLTDSQFFSGNEEFTKPDGNGKETGHIGNGIAKITPE